MKLIPLFVASILLASPAKAAPADADAFHREIAALYAFDSKTGSQVELDARFEALDRFAERMKAAKEHYLPLLRNELAKGPYTPVFATMGPVWLTEMSSDPADLQLAADSLARWNLDQVNPEGYVTVLHGLAARGANVTAAAMRIADWPDFFATLSVHMMPVGQSDAMILLLFSMPEDRFVQAVAQRLRTEPNPKTQKGLLLIAYSTATSEGVAALQAFAARTDIRAELREEARKYLAHKGHVHDRGMSPDQLRKMRLEAVRKPVGHDHERGTIFHELTEALIYHMRRERQSPSRN